MSFLKAAAVAERICIFIDGANLWSSATELGIRIDYLKLLNYLTPKGTYCVGARYFTAIDEDVDGNKRLHPLLHFLSHNGFTVISKPAKSYYRDGTERRVKGNMDVEFTIDVLEVGMWVDRVVLVTGDGDFTELVRTLKRRGRRVTVVSSETLLSSDLRKEADEVVDISKIVSSII